jgi:hypothetical protein
MRTEFLVGTPLYSVNVGLAIVVLAEGARVLLFAARRTLDDLSQGKPSLVRVRLQKALDGGAQAGPITCLRLYMSTLLRCQS